MQGTQEIINSHSTFKIECDTKYFTNEEIQLLLKYGAWLRSLMHGGIQPQTDKQRHFFNVCSLTLQPETEYEFVWIKYLQQLGKEADKIKYIQQNNSFSSRSNSKNSNLNINHIQKVVCKFHDLSLEQLLSRNKTKIIAETRQIAMYLSKEMTSHSLPEIGDSFGGRDHTTVLHAVKKITELKNNNKDLDVQIQELTRLILESGSV